MPWMMRKDDAMARGQCQVCGGKVASEIAKDEQSENWACCYSCCRKTGYSFRFGVDHCISCPITQKKQGADPKSPAAETA
jgi:hypothetical protein